MERRLGRSHRLRTPREFQRVSRQGRRVSSRNFVVLAARRGVETRFVRLGLTVSRRVGGAVVRNQVKRRLREWFRSSSLRAGAAIDLVVIARPPAARLAWPAFRDDLEDLGRQALAEAGR